MWPAFWLLGNDIGSVGWPACGETDIMESVGQNPGTVYGSIHGPNYVGLTGSTTLPNGQNLGDDFHVYTAEWEPTEIRFYLDGTLYKAFTQADIPSGSKWVLDHPNFILLNLAVGGGWPADPDGTTQFPAQMKVDYVRVYIKG
jgi:beta-glucanase (GH16 family)